MHMGTFGDITDDQESIEYWPVAEIQAWRGFPAYVLVVMVSSAWLCYAFGNLESFVEYTWD
jgi:hypothetical protein